MENKNHQVRKEISFLLFARMIFNLEELFTDEDVA